MSRVAPYFSLSIGAGGGIAIGGLDGVAATATGAIAAMATIDLTTIDPITIGRIGPTATDIPIVAADLGFYSASKGTTAEAAVNG